jgi:cytochrome d ubiquinol oxidase subunit I
MGMVFYAFRIMYGLAMVMFAVGVASLWLRFRGKLFSSRWFLWILVFMTPSGIIATLAGWYVAETGRQPWVIYGILRTVDAISPVPAQALLSTLIAFVCVYAVFITAFLVFAFRIIRRGPAEVPPHAEASGSVKNAFRPYVLDSPERLVNSNITQRS